MSNLLRMLMVEDSADDAELLAHELRRAGFALEFERVDNAAALEAALDRATWDIIIGDNSMPGFSGTEALGLLRARGLDIPFIFVSGTMGENEGDVQAASPKETESLRAAESRHAVIADDDIPRGTVEGRFQSRRVIHPLELQRKPRAPELVCQQLGVIC